MYSGLLRTCARRTFGKRAYSDIAFTFAAPTKVFYHDAVVKQVDVPTFSGNFGILPKHVPTLTVLKPGLVTVFETDGAAKKFIVSSGSVTINDDGGVQILAEEACNVDELDAAAIQSGISNADSKLRSASTDVEKAEAQIEIDAWAELQKCL